MAADDSHPCEPLAVDTHIAAKMLGVSAGTLANWRCQGRGPRHVAFPSGGGRPMVRYRVSDLEDWLADNLVETSD